MSAEVTPTRFVAQRMRELRRARGWSADRLVEELAKHGVHWNRGVVTKLETGRRESVSVAELLGLASAFEVLPLALLPAAERRLDPRGAVSVDLATHEAVEQLERIDAMLDRCRDRGVRLSHLEAARNALADLTGKHAAAVAELQQLRAEAAAPRARCYYYCRGVLGIVVCTDCTEDLAAEGRRLAEAGSAPVWPGLAKGAPDA